MRPLLSILVAPAIVATALAAAPVGSAEVGFAEGSYAVPDVMGYGKYVADIAPGSGGCTFSTYDAQGLPVDTVSTFAKPLTAAVGPSVASFRTSGCTPWVRFSRILNGN